jgi:hypothetical protein
LRQQSFEFNEREAEKEHLRVKEAWVKFEADGEEVEQDEK